ncbi:endonuclease-reverse transcriptase, partial [Plakobranchus ocellatus]
FQCRAWNPVLQEFELSKHAEISNKVKPSSDLPVILWDQPPVLVVGEGHDLVLPCKSTESTEPTKVSWYLGRYRVDESKRVYALSDSDNNLGFFPIRPQDSGQYSCRAQNSKGTVESPALDLVVAYLNIEFAVQPSNTFSVYGASAVLHCEPPDSIPVAQVFWYKDYLPLNLQAEENKGRLMLVGKGDLHLTSVQKSDNGLYYCEAYNNFTTPTSRASRQARLTVEGPPMIKVPPIRTEILKGTLLQLKCLVDADPTPVVMWMFEGRLIEASSMVSFVNRSQALIISNVDKSWEGWFTCRALNSYGNISADAFVTVIVPPESLRAIGNLVVTAGLPIRIPCPVLSDPMPEILWFYNNVQVYPKDMGAPSTLRWRVDSPDLYLDEAVPENAGNFTCVGINKGGSASSSGSLVVHTSPAVKVSPLKSTAVIGQTVTLTCVADGLPTPTIVWKFNTSLDLPMEVELSEDKETLTLKSLSWKSVGIYTCEGENIVGQGQAQAEVKAMDFGIGKVTHLLNEIYDTGQIPTDLSKSIFIALPKKPGATESELHRTISLMSHITKILLKIIMLRIRNKIKPEIAEEQCGFVEDKGTSNAIYILRTSIECALEVQKDLYLCFIDYTKAFDRVRHDEILKQLKQLNIDGKDLRIIKTMYWEQTAAMRIENKTSTFQDIKRGVQGCVLSPDLFSLYSEIIMRNLENHPGIKVGGQNINNLRYADNTVLIAENKEDLQKLLNIIEEESRKKGLELNSKKTEVMVINCKQESPKCDIFINEVKLKQTEKFKYLGTIISNDGKTNREISARTAQAKINFQKMKTILTNKHISIKMRKRALQCYIEPVLMYGCEAWTISKQIQNKLEATEMWFLRRMLRIPWTAKKTNERVLNEANNRRSLFKTIRKRQAIFLGHVMRRGNLEHLVTTGKFEGKRSRGRQREKIMDGLATWLGPGTVSDILAAVKDRDLWRDMIANAYKQGT